MILYFIIVVLIVLASSSIRSADGWKDNYISKEQSRNIEGIFVLLVFLGHVISKIDSDTILDTIYYSIWKRMDQTIVVMFFFYSGFGLTQSFVNKGKEYIRNFPATRFLPLLIKYEVVTLLYLIMNLLFGIVPDIKELLISFTGLKGIVNYSWFIFDVFCLYFLFEVSFLIAVKIKSLQKSLITGASVLTMLSIVLFFVLKHVVMWDIWIYNTILLFSFGSWYAICKKKIDTFFESNSRFVVSSILCAALCIASECFKNSHLLIHEIRMFCFASAIVLLTMKIRINSKILAFFGSIAFPMLMLQGMSFNVLSKLNIQSSPYLFVFLSFAVSVMLSVAFNKVASIFEKKGRPKRDGQQS